MLISVVTSVRNGEKFLPRCLESVRAAADAVSDRALVHIEHVICDGASTDGTAAILERQAGVRWTSEADSGQSEGFNKGVAMAKGEWICWLNADDELAPGTFASFFKTLAKNPQADVIYGHTTFIDENSRPLWTSYHLPYRRCLIANNVYVPPTSGTFFRRELLLREPIDPNYHYVMDVEWFLRCNDRIKAVLSDHVFCRFRVSSVGKTSGMIKTGQVTAKHLEERERYRTKYIYSRWPNLTKDQAQRKLARLQKLYRLYYYLLKLPYTPRYLANRLFPQATARTEGAPPSLKTEH
jgi:glycosyltransferase involved in cell wall biosynthesis